MGTPVNITQGKAASASSFVMPYSASRAVDGSTEKYSRWQCASSGTSWLMVNLGGYYKVTSWLITSIGQAGWSPTCNLNSFALQSNVASLTAPVWVSVDAVSENMASSVSRVLPIPTVANALRINITKGDSRALSTLASILEFAAMGYPVSNNANLANLTLSAGASLNPVFSPSVTSYTASVANSVASITVIPTAADAEATITVNGQGVLSGATSQVIGLNIGANTVTVVGKSPDMTTTKTYTVVITRQDIPASNANLSRLTISRGTLTPDFSKDVTAYTDSVGYDVTSVTVTPTAEDSSATIKVNGSSVQNGQSSAGIGLNVGSNNAIGVEVTGSAGNKKTYNISVTRASSPYLTKVDVTYISGKSTIVSPIIISKNQTEYNADIPNTVTRVTITAYSEDSSGRILVNGNQNLTNGQVSAAITVNTAAQTRIPINVTSNVGTDNKAYGITIV